MKKVLYIASLSTKNDKYDGERIKSTLILSALEKKAIVKTLNLSKHKLLTTIRLVFYSLFRKNHFDNIVISKDARGAKIIHSILRKCSVYMKKVVYFEIGPFLYDIIETNNGLKTLFLEDGCIIVETEMMKNDLIKFGFTNVVVFPNFKQIPSLSLTKKQYPKKVLNIVYFSRIEEMKGIYDLIEVIKRVNKTGVKYTLSIFGMFQTKNDKKRIEQLENDYIHYNGKLDLTLSDNYYLLSKYDLHAFPTKYGEGVPGSLIDFFILGIPTISSNFARSADILTEKDTFFFEQGNKMALEEMLEYIYKNQNSIVEKGVFSYEKRKAYSFEAFEAFLGKIMKYE